jgi:hypothetical protein
MKHFNASKEEIEAIAEKGTALTLVLGLLSFALIPLVRLTPCGVAWSHHRGDPMGLFGVVFAYLSWGASFTTGQAIYVWWASNRKSRGRMLDVAGSGVIATMPFLIYMVLTITLDSYESIGRFLAFPLSGLGGAFTFGIAQEYAGSRRWLSLLISVATAVLLFLNFHSSYWELRGIVL